MRGVLAACLLRTHFSNTHVRSISALIIFAETPFCFISNLEIDSVGLHFLVWVSWRQTSSWQHPCLNAPGAVTNKTEESNRLFRPNKLLRSPTLTSSVLHATESKQGLSPAQEHLFRKEWVVSFHQRWPSTGHGSTWPCSLPCSCLQGHGGQEEGAAATSSNEAPVSVGDTHGGVQHVGWDAVVIRQQRQSVVKGQMLWLSRIDVFQMVYPCQMCTSGNCKSVIPGCYKWCSESRVAPCQ